MVGGGGGQGGEQSLKLKARHVIKKGSMSRGASNEARSRWQLN